MLSLSITGFSADPKRVTDILGIEPTSVVREGEITPSGRPSKFNGWWFDAAPGRLRDGADHADALAVIVQAIQGREAAFIVLRNEVQPASVFINGGLYHRADSQCGIWLDAKDMAVLAAGGVSWGLDIYDEESSSPDA